MAAATRFEIPREGKAIDLGGRDFADHKWEYFRWMLEHAPLCRARIAFVKVHVISRYEECVSMLKDPRFVRNRTTATGGNRMPFPMPRSAAMLAQSMIVEDDPAHRRLRGLVNKAFTPRAVDRLTARIESVTEELLDGLSARETVDLREAYATPIPVTVISELVGIADGDVPRFRKSLRVLSEGLTGWSLLRTIAWDLRRCVRFVSHLVERKRSNPQDDILTALIHSEEEGDRLDERELVSMVFLLIIAGYETTLHLITNGVLTLLQHPEQMERLRAEPWLLDSAVEEILRYRGPVQMTKLMWATEDVTFEGGTIPRGAAAIPMLGAANHDPRAFDGPETFDIARTPNRHLAFGFGAHFCLGARLARTEARVAIARLIERFPRLRLAVSPGSLRIQRLPGWHRYESLPVALR